jgi:hypothetical protein
MRSFRFFSVTVVLLLASTTLASAELLALLNYESKPDQAVRREGIAIMDIDPESADFGTILMEIPLPSDQGLHHRLGEKPSARRGPHPLPLPAARD